MKILRITAPSIFRTGWFVETRGLTHDLLHQTRVGLGVPMHTHLRLQFPLFSGGCCVSSPLWQVVPPRLKEMRINPEEDKWKDNFNYPWQLGY